MAKKIIKERRQSTPDFIMLRLSLLGLAERGSIRLKFSESVRIEFDKPTQEVITDLLDSLRATNFPDKGLSLDITETKRLNSGAVELIMFIVDNIIERNIVGFDLFHAENPNPVVSALLKEIKSKVKDNTSIRLRPVRPLVKKIDLGLLFTMFIGVGLIIGGQFLESSKFVWGKSQFEANFVTLSGVLFLVFSFLPRAIGLIKMYRKEKIEKLLDKARGE